MKQTKKHSKRNLSAWMLLSLLFLVVIAACAPKSTASLPASPEPSAGEEPGQSATVQGTRKQVLIIHSYHIGYKWTDDTMRGLVDVFKADGSIDLRVEYLDTKRVANEEYLEQVFQLFRHKYQDVHLDLIVSSDDPALNFLFKYADQLFPETPVVFVGANYFDETRLQGFKRFTGISEEADIAGTLDLALRLHPEVRNIVIVNDTSVTGQNIHKNLETLIPRYPQLTFELLEDTTMQEVQQHVAALPPGSLVLLTIFFRDNAGGFYEYDQFTTLIGESSSVPVYGTWDFSLGYGIVGGKLTSGYTEGQRAANLALRVLNGERPHTIPVEKQRQSRYMFDLNVLEKWGIDESSLPQDSRILNRPVSFYEANKPVVWGVSIVLLVLLFMVVFLVFNNHQRRIAQDELAQTNLELKALHVSLEQRVAERTQALTSVAEVSTAASAILETEKLLQQVVDLAKERFGFYHVHIYLLDQTAGSLVLSSGAGEVGRQMVARGHSIPMDREESLVARATRDKQGVTVNDVTQAPDFLSNPLLPETRSELAVPMMIGEHVIGVFDVQSEVVGRFTDADIAVQTTLASQVAAALQNARSYSEIQRSQDQLAEALRISRLGNWEYDVEKDLFTFNDQFYSIFRTSADQVGGYKLSSADYARLFVHPEDASLVRSEFQKAMANQDRHFRASLEHRSIFSNGEVGYITLNINVERDNNGKILRWYGANQDVTERRQLEELNRKRAAQQEAINTIAHRIQGATTIEFALQIAARELGHALGGRETQVTLERSAPSNTAQSVTE